jgi:hypothetical protein
MPHHGHHSPAQQQLNTNAQIFERRWDRIAEVDRRQRAGALAGNLATTNVEVIERVPWWQQRFMQSKFMQPNWFGGATIGRLPNYGRNSFTLHEYGYGAPTHDRKSVRYRVVERTHGFVLPGQAGTNPPAHPNARNPYDNPPDPRHSRWGGAVPPRDPRNTQPTRLDMLVLGTDGRSSWVGAQQRYDRGAIAVGKDLAPIGTDARDIAHASRAARIGNGVLNFPIIGLFTTAGKHLSNYKERTPNQVIRGAWAFTRVERGDHLSEADLEAKAAKVRSWTRQLRLLQGYAESPTGTTPPAMLGPDFAQSHKYNSGSNVIPGTGRLR